MLTLFIHSFAASSLFRFVFFVQVDSSIKLIEEAVQLAAQAREKIKAVSDIHQADVHLEIEPHEAQPS